nr:uncharacterized protein TP_0956-like [Nerophis lumbriciformis]
MHSRTHLRVLAALAALLTALLLLGGCSSIRRAAIGQAAKALTKTGDLFASDDDPQLVREATPFALKTLEGLILERPKDAGLLLATCQAFTQYTLAFIEVDAREVEFKDFRRARGLRQRALRLHLRAKGYCTRALELTFPGVLERLRTEPEQALAGIGEQHVGLLFWTGAAWGAAVARGLDQPELLGEVPAVRALARRALELDPDFQRGLLQEAMMVLESIELMGGSKERARAHFDRALELSGGRRVSPYVAYAAAVSVDEQDRAEFARLLEQALAIDAYQPGPDRLANLVNQRLARILLSQIDDLFLDDLEDDWDDPEETAEASGTKPENP